jgi:pyruvate dehydrogenase (quinone)
MKVGDFVVKRLHAWGVRRIYGYPGDGINGVIGALQRANKIDFIQVRHEEMAAFMAVAHAKFTGEIGVCLSTGGPGASHLITGLYNAKLDHAPVLGRHLINRCIRMAKANNGPSIIILPKDIQDEKHEEPAVAHGFTRSGVGYSKPNIVPRRGDRKAGSTIRAALGFSGCRNLSATTFKVHDNRISRRDRPIRLPIGHPLRFLTTQRERVSSAESSDALILRRNAT